MATEKEIWEAIYDSELGVVMDNGEDALAYDVFVECIAKYLTPTEFRDFLAESMPADEDDDSGDEEE